MLYRSLRGYSDKAKELARLDLSPNRSYRIDRDWAEYVKCFSNPFIFPKGIENFIKARRGAAVLELGAGVGLAAEYFKATLGVASYDNLALTPSNSPAIDREFLGDVDSFNYAVLGQYDLIIGLRGGLYHGKQPKNALLALAGHLKRGGVLAADYANLKRDEESEVAEYLSKSGYEVDFDFIRSSGEKFIFIKRLV